MNENVEKNSINKEIAVKFDNISFSYVEGIQVLDSISFQINVGEYVCVLGHNGSGKSTISKILVGLLKPNAGTVNIMGEELSVYTLKKIRNSTGIVFQNPDNQFIGMTAEDDIAFGLENRKYTRERMKEVIQQVAKQVKITDLLGKEPSKLSGGQKQRVAIAGILAFNPSVMVFDEFTSMLDPKGKIQLKQTLVELRKSDSKKTIISITHDMEEVINADKVIVLYKGKIRAMGNPKEIFQDYKFIQEMRLDFPFALKVSSMLHEKINEIDPTIQTEKFIDQLCSK
jgi:energy-coupling factor transport system ATP-binding protein